MAERNRDKEVKEAKRNSRELNRETKKSRSMKTKTEQGFRKRNQLGRKPMVLGIFLPNEQFCFIFQFSPIIGLLCPFHLKT